MPSTVVFDYPTVEELAAHLIEELTRSGAAGGNGMDARLDELESMLPSIEGEDGGRERLAVRLKALLTVLYGDDSAGAEGNIDTATDDELFELIDKGLGAR